MSNAPRAVPRLLVGFVVALLVARPVVGDPAPAATGSHLLALGWFVALVAWAAWNLVRRPGRRIGGWVALLLVVAAGLLARRMWAEPLTWAGVTTAGSLATAFAVYVVVRQTTADVADANGLFAALAASAVAAVADTALPGFLGTTPAPADGRELGWLALALPAVLVLSAARIRATSLLPLAVIGVAVAGTWGDLVPPAAPWESTAAMLRDHSDGVGPGMYDHFAARVASPESELVVTSPGTFAGWAATCGWPAAGAFALAVVATWIGRWSTIVRVESAGPRWELYGGGIVGLLVGFVLQVGDLPSGHGLPIRELGTAAVVRGAVWFAAFAAFAAGFAECRWRTAVARVALVAMAATALGYDTLGRPATTQAFWALAALTPNLGRPLAPSAVARGVGGRVLPLLFAGALGAGFAWHVFLPAFGTARALHAAYGRMRPFADIERKIDATPTAFRTQPRAEAVKYLRKFVLPNLAAAAKTNRLDPTPPVEISAWLLKLWEQGADGDPDFKAMIAAKTAQELDPEGVAGYDAEIALRSRFAERTAVKRDEQFAHLDRLIKEVVARDPARHARLRFAMAKVYFAAGDEAGGRSAATSALRLDADAPGSRYRLTSSECEQATKWASGP